MKFLLCSRCIEWENTDNSLSKDFLYQFHFSAYWKNSWIVRVVTNPTQPQRNINLNCSWVWHENDCANHPTYTTHPPTRPHLQKLNGSNIWSVTHTSYLNEGQWKTDKDCLVLGHMAIISFTVLCKCRNVLKRAKTYGLKRTKATK